MMRLATTLTAGLVLASCGRLATAATVITPLNCGPSGPSAADIVPQGAIYAIGISNLPALLTCKVWPQ